MLSLHMFCIVILPQLQLMLFDSLLQAICLLVNINNMFNMFMVALALIFVLANLHLDSLLCKNTEHFV